jgi:hypothetical protein
VGSLTRYNESPSLDIGPMTTDQALDRMPVRETYGKERLTTLDHLLHGHRKRQAGEIVTMTSADRQVLGYGLPSWQRDQVWSTEQCARFIQSVWQGRPLGTWMVNMIDANTPHPLDGLILDGQQRLFAIERYFNDEIAILPAEGGDVLNWSDLTAREQRRFGRSVFAHLEINIHDEVRLQQIYDAHNFGGVPHQAHERAIGTPLDTEKETPAPAKRQRQLRAG